MIGTTSPAPLFVRRLTTGLRLAAPRLTPKPGMTRGALALALLVGVACADHTTPTIPVPTPPTATSSKFAVGLSLPWEIGGNQLTAYQVGTDSGVVHGGTHAASIRSTAPTATTQNFSSFGQLIRADDYRGHRVRLRGWVRTQAAQGDGAGLWLRIDGLGTYLALDNSSGRRVTGTADWREMQIIIDVPQAADGLAFGGLLNGGGQAWFDDLAVDLVASDVPVTTTPTIPDTSDSTAAAQMRSNYVLSARAPTNLDFEGATAAPLDAGAVSWLKANAVPLSTVDPTVDLGDLAPLGAMIGRARLVGFGEGTHGTHEFQLMKHRVLEYLVRQQDFTAFALEASWPEANALDRYVRTGAGEPAVLLANLYFWTWNTQEVLDMIRWMRAYNAGVSPDRQVGFYGFDMQYAGTAIDNVTAFFHRADPSQVAMIDTAYACLTPYRNHGLRVPSAMYSQVSADVRTACAGSVARPYVLLAGAAARYTAATSQVDYAEALQSARIVVQWEDVFHLTSSAEINATRDRYMAENVGWLIGQRPTGTRMMLWAHNLHVSRSPNWMGSHLAATFGADYVNAGFAFGTGTFNAYSVAADGTSAGLLGPQTAPPVAAGSVEAYAMATGLPEFLLDARQIPGASAAAALAGPIGLREIGAGFYVGSNASYVTPTYLPGDFDLLIYLHTSTPSQLLPFPGQ